ncbi:hypothetical protein AB0873_15090 [Micromonospora sp. NPDC047707]|uniref:hypothetical protein n=1 Tax=Micromonospora sp. NPDC047707 TaxID=3154498 RepID=UPI0034562550
MTALRAGVVVELNARASVQFAGSRALRLRIVRVDPQPTYHGWVWLTGYVIDQRGTATARREVYVQRAGVVVVNPAAAALRPAAEGTGRNGRECLTGGATIDVRQVPIR